VSGGIVFLKKKYGRRLHNLGTGNRAIWSIVPRTPRGTK
jgi:hypothetical protein